MRSTQLDMSKQILPYKLYKFEPEIIKS